ncbi:hypothetical protein O181_066956 [Austropuccinia psidii MF-1]|uniref:t-SNARE coiled-coil homology domain-containing protein n=1 Tax=Austropuccinia psidii MF-1 TaxID=1389203 RepID=A0A9Q3EYN4_9BASI|nr:hypothetical protein [Austropuccinia psidii MF-1]
MSTLTRRDPNRAALLSGRPVDSSSTFNSPQPYSNTSIPSYGRSYNSPYGSHSNHLTNSSNHSSFSNHRTAEELESQNDEALEGLSAKVRLLKEISVNIGTEVKDSTKFLSTMNDTFSEATGLLSGTFRKMNRMAKTQTGRWWYWLLFLILVFWIFVITWLWRH